MSVNKISISFESELGAAVRRAASQNGQQLSAWLAEAAADKLRSEALAAFLDEWDTEHTPLTPEEIATAERELGLGGVDSSAAA